MESANDYTLEEIEYAFRESFYAAGELWFSTETDPESAEEHIRWFWNDFLDNLQRVRRKEPHAARSKHAW